MPFYDVIKDIILMNWTSSILENIPTTGLLYGSDISALFTASWTFIINCFTMLFVQNIGVFVYLTILFFLVLPFFINIGKYVVSEMLYGYMSSQAKTSFCAVLVKTLGKSTAYASLKTLFNIPSKAVVVLMLFGIAMINVSVFDYFLPFVVILAVGIILSLGQSASFGWAPAIVVYGTNISKSYRIGIKSVARRFAKVFSTIFVINVIFTFLIMGFGLVSSIVFIPLYLGLVSMFEMVLFYGSQGMRYYVDQDTVLTPKKLEQQDKIKKTKYII